MPNKRPRIAFVGDFTGPLASELSRDFDLVSGERGEDDVLCIAFDGQSPESNAERPVAALRGGKTVAIVRPREDQLSQLGSLTGQGLGPAALVAFAPSSPGRYSSGVTPDGTVEARMLAADRGGSIDAAPCPTSPVNIDVAASLRRTLEQFSAAPGEAGLPADDVNLAPPFSCLWGHETYTTTIPAWTMEPPTYNNKPDDSVAQHSQTVTGGTLVSDLYVYWVDGNAPPNSPYYVVVLVQRGGPSPGSPAANVPNSRGYFQYGSGFNVEITQPDEKPFQGGVTLLQHSPATSVSIPGLGVPVTLQQEMTLLNKTTNMRTAFTANFEEHLALTDWGVNDTSNPASQQVSWYFYQIDGWNPIKYPPETLSEWLKAVYSDNDQVIEMSQTAWNLLQAGSASAWKFDSSLVGDGEKLEILVKFEMSQDVGLFHNPSACLGAAGGKHHHLFLGNVRCYLSRCLNLHDILGRTK
jgi:hypothetical protein